MLKFSELSLEQRNTVWHMKEGHELRWDFGLQRFMQKEGKKEWPLNDRTAKSLINRHFIHECFRDKGVIVYCLDVEIIWPTVRVSNRSPKEWE